jgi:hypothetical protein
VQLGYLRADDTTAKTNRAADRLQSTAPVVSDSARKLLLVVAVG